MEILERVAGVKALINITSDGLLNLARVEAKVGFEITKPSAGKRRPFAGPSDVDQSGWEMTTVPPVLWIRPSTRP
jgi:hypothetical protein